VFTRTTFESLVLVSALKVKSLVLALRISSFLTLLVNVLLFHCSNLRQHLRYLEVNELGKSWISDEEMVQVRTDDASYLAPV